MGFSGTFIVHRGQTLLEELLPRVAAFRDAILCYDGVSGDWQVTRVFARAEDLPLDFLAALRNATGAPVLAADIIDSDAALVRGLGYRTDFAVWLHLNRAMAFLAPSTASLKAQILAAIPGGAEAAAEAIGWAHEAGLRPGSMASVTELLAGERDPVEWRFFALLNLLGLATDQVTTPEPPAPVDVLRRWLGHCLVSVDLVAHRPVRGERLSHAGMPDLRLGFERQPAVTACACTGDFYFLPDRSRQTVALGAVAQAPDQLLRAAATIRQGYLPSLMGVVLRFADGDLYLAGVKGAWIAAFGSDGFQRRLDELGGADARLNSWIA